jgi:hypothetical protein
MKILIVRPADSDFTSLFTKSIFDTNTVCTVHTIADALLHIFGEHFDLVIGTEDLPEGDSHGKFVGLAIIAAVQRKIQLTGQKVRVAVLVSETSQFYSEKDSHLNLRCTRSGEEISYLFTESQLTFQGTKNAIELALFPQKK